MLVVTSPWALIISLLTAIVSIFFYNRNPSAPDIGSPHCASWNAWYNPLRTGQTGYQDNDWNIVYHLGGNGPWIEKTDGLETPGLKPPKECVIDQVHLVRLSSIPHSPLDGRLQSEFELSLESVRK